MQPKAACADLGFGCWADHVREPAVSGAYPDHISDTLTDDEVTRLLPILAARARATEKTSAAFRPPRTGIVEQVAADWHHFVVGRRGVGKSMLLLNVAKHAADAGRPAVYIDLETLRDNPYPDVLVRLLIELAGESSDISGDSTPRSSRVGRPDGGCAPYEGGLRCCSATRSRRTTTSRVSAVLGARRGGSAGVSGSPRRPAGVAAQLEGAAERGSAESSAFGREASFARTKLEGLQSEATEFREVLHASGQGNRRPRGARHPGRLLLHSSGEPTRRAGIPTAGGEEPRHLAKGGRCRASTE